MTKVTKVYATPITPAKFNAIHDRVVENLTSAGCTLEGVQDSIKQSAPKLEVLEDLAFGCGGIEYQYVMNAALALRARLMGQQTYVERLAKEAQS